MYTFREFTGTGKRNGAQIKTPQARKETREGRVTRRVSSLASSGHEIAPNTVANATKITMLANKI